MRWRTNTTFECQVLDWHSRKHSRVVRSTYAAELLSLLDAVNQGGVLNLCFEEVVNGAMSPADLLNRRERGLYSIPMDAETDARSVFQSITAPEGARTPDDKHLHLHALAMRLFLKDGMVDQLHWNDAVGMLPDGLTKGKCDREPLMVCCKRGDRRLTGNPPEYKGFGD